MTRKEWKKRPLGEIAEEVRLLYTPNRNENLKYIGLEHINQDTLSINGMGTSSTTQSSKKKFDSTMILFGSLRVYFRKVYLPKFSGVCSADITVLKAKKGTDKKFLFYFIANRDFINIASNFSNGTKMPRANWKALSKKEWIFPDEPTQEKIGSTLANYDDLIENNSRRIHLLESMAKLIYDEWFVKFKFPGHETVKMVDSELGKIPEGWELKKLGEVLELAYGKGLNTDVRISGDYPVYGSSGIVGTHNEFLVSAPGLVVGRKGNVGSVFWVDYSFYPIDTVYFVKSELSFYYLFFNLKTQNFLNNDAAVPGLNRNQAYGLKMIKPKDNVLMNFDRIITPIFQMIRVLKERNQHLAATRDLLLPKLISGDLDVSDLDIKISEVEA